ncbi:MAG TPA: DNRLRE domain-containing protein [Chthoniobacter sp.]|jgi:hypothetical protein
MKVALLVLLAFFCTVSLHANVAVCPAAHDTSLDAGDVNNSDGGGPAFFVGTDGDDETHRALISFDLSSIPAGSTITNVQLVLTLSNVAGGGGGGGGTEPSNATISLYALTRSWGEGTSESDALGVNGTGHGAPASAGDATWDAAMFDETNGLWANPGGDFNSTASGSLFLNGNMVNTAFTWLSTPQMVADVQGWLNNSATNYGWILINADETDPRTLYGFYSRTWSTFPGAQGQANFEPALQVTFTPPGVPVPPWASWAGLAAVAFVSLRALRRNGSSREASFPLS